MYVNKRLGCKILLGVWYVNGVVVVVVEAIVTVKNT